MPQDYLENGADAQHLSVSCMVRVSYQGGELEV